MQSCLIEYSFLPIHYAQLLFCMKPVLTIFETSRFISTTGDTNKHWSKFSFPKLSILNQAPMLFANNEILNMLTGIIHSYTTLQLKCAFSNPDKVRNDLCDALEVLLTGIQMNYNH